MKTRRWIIPLIVAVLGVGLLWLLLGGERIEEGRCRLRPKANRDRALRAYSVYYQSGRLSLDGKTYKVAVIDGDSDGQYKTRLSLPVDRGVALRCDLFAVDLNGDGGFENSSLPHPEITPVGKLVEIRRVYYAVDIASDGTRLTLTRTEPQLGTLTIEPNDVDVELRLWSDAADQYIPSGRQWQLPAGKYMATRTVLRKTDAGGNVWMFSSITSVAYPRLGPLDFFTIEPGQTTSIRIGPPFVLKADVQKAGPGTVLIGCVLVGCGGEEYSTGFEQGGRNSRWRLPPPAFKIVDEKGTVLVTSNFEYG